MGEIAGGILTADVIQGAARRATQFVSSSITAAKDLGESLNAVDKIFGSSAATVKDWGANNAVQFGLSQRAFNQMATPLGAMLKNSGMAMDQVADHTIKLTERAADMASVFNTDVTDALTAIQAGLRGESDPLERFGVKLNEAAVQTRALADTGKANAASLTDQEKAAARLALIYDQTADSAGDFKDTSDGLANAQRIATAQIEEAQAKLGTAFLPIMAKAAQVTGAVAEKFTAMPQPVQTATAAVVGLAAAAVILIPRIAATKTALNDLGIIGENSSGKLGKVARAAGLAAAAFGALQVVSGIVGAFTKDLNPQMEAATAGLLRYANGAALAGEAQRVFAEDTGLLGRSLAAVAGSGFSKWLSGVEAGLGLDGGALDDVNTKVNAFDAALADLVRSGNADAALKLLTQAAGDAKVSVDDAKAVLPQYGAALELAATSTGKVATASQDAAEEIKDLGQAVDEQIDKLFGLESAQDDVADAVADLKEQFKEQKKAGDAGAGTLDRHTQAGRDNADAVRSLVSKYGDMAQKMVEGGKSTDRLRDKLYDQLRALGVSKSEAARYADALGKVASKANSIPKRVTSTITVTTKYVTIGTGPNKASADAHGGITGAASGGARGGLVEVGEEGPELVRLPFGSTVIPNGTSRAMMSDSNHPGWGGGGAPAAPTGQPLVLSGNAVLSALFYELVQYARRQHGVNLVAVPAT